MVLERVTQIHHLECRHSAEAPLLLLYHLESHTSQLLLPPLKKNLNLYVTNLNNLLV